MILRGILDNSLGQLCIRGYAFLKDLELTSKANMSFQRNLIESQEKVIKEFLYENPNLFFPEVILSYQLKYDYSRSDSDSNVDPVVLLKNGLKFKSNVDKIEIIPQKISFKNQLDDRGLTNINIVSIKIDDAFLTNAIKEDKQPFFRVDGNHRLSAAKEFEEQSIRDLVCPFCIILLPEGSDSVQFEKIIFHNINSKSMPLTSEEVKKVILDDEVSFTDAFIELDEKNFGKTYFHTRKLLKEITLDNYQSLLTIMSDREKKIDNYRSIFVNLFSLLEGSGNTDFNSKYRSIKKGLDLANALYETNPQLKESRSPGLLLTFLFFAVEKEIFYLNWLLEWVIENRIYELTEIQANELIQIFEKIIVSRERTIFLSMPFDDSVSEHYELIHNLIDEINSEQKAKIKIKDLRIDKYSNGSAYKIPDKLLEKIEDTGLLIADLTNGNKNVYHEVGYRMAMNKINKKKKLSLILICNQKLTSVNEVGFNIKSHKILLFNNVTELKPKLKAEILNYYFKE
jgi:hypothetical protein